MKSAPILAATIAATLGLTLSLPSASGRGGRIVRQPSTQQNSQKNGVNETVNAGQLTSDESDGLKAQSDALQKQSDGLPGDETLTKDQCDALQSAIDAASMYIWSKGADDDGKVATRYASSIFPVDALTKAIDGHTITSSEARTVLSNLRALIAAKLRLNESDLTGAARVALQKEFNAGLAKYYAAK
jgi:hypothetical protein